MPEWTIGTSMLDVLDHLRIPCLIAPLSSASGDESGMDLLVWRTPPNVDPRFPKGARHLEYAASDAGQKWFAEMPYQHSPNAHGSLAASAAGGVLARLQPH